MDHSRVGNVAAGVIALCAVAVTTSVVRREFFAPPPPKNESPVVSINNWKEYASRGQRIGPVSAAVTITEFSDFECPYCAQFEKTVAALRDKYPTKVALVYRHFPLENLHKHARDAALASECAAADGKFEAFHRALFASQDSIGLRSWGQFAKSVEISDTTAFAACVQRASYSHRLEEDVAAGKKLNVTGTPTYLINETKISGILPLEELERYVEKALGRS